MLLQLSARSSWLRSIPVSTTETMTLELPVVYSFHTGLTLISNPGFVAKAPEAKIAEEKQKLEKYKEMLKTTEERLNNL